MIGTDYELFMEIDGKIVPVPDSVNIGSKNGIHTQLNGGTMHRDNVMVELCPKPSDNAKEFTANILQLNLQAEEYMSEIMGAPVILKALPTVEFEGDVLASQSAQELGCDRDYLAVPGAVISRLPLTARKLGVHRCGGGHIHMSYGVTAAKPPSLAVQLSDLTLGTLEATFGSQGKRRDYYGMPGLFRPKTYGNIRGVEYRTPSNLWLENATYIDAMATNAIATEAVLKNESDTDIMALIVVQHEQLVVRSVLDTENSEEASAIIAAVRNAFPKYEWKVGV